VTQIADIAGTVFIQFGNVLRPAVINMAILAVVFTLLARVGAWCNPGPSWWRKPDLALDLCFALLPKLLNAYAYLILLLLLFGLIYGLNGDVAFAAFLAHGHGPLDTLAAWQQVIVYLLGNDLLMYWTHRGFHSVRLWRFHAVHHASQHLEWVSASRFHPVDQLFHAGLSDIGMLLLGISPEVLALLAPWSVGSSALVHANLNWTFGPFRYVLASPVFHRWHHTRADRGGSSNFAGTFPFIDMVFGTFYMPKDALPDAFGVDDPDFPRGFWGQLWYPFRPAPPPVRSDLNSG
jgi:hypothetical protein